MRILSPKANLSEEYDGRHFSIHQQWLRFVESSTLPQSLLCVHKQAELVGFLEADQKKTFATLSVV